MANKMLIDASHPEETRVVVLRGNKVQEFDFEAADKKPLRGNIYLAKVTRVEPSLQAAFVEYGGNRHGFLAFAEIHPDYYQIPVADRLALLEEESRAHRLAEEEEPRPPSQNRGRRSRRRHHDNIEKRAPADDAVIAEPAFGDEEIETPSADFGVEAVAPEAAPPETAGEGAPEERTGGERLEGGPAAEAAEPPREAQDALHPAPQALESPAPADAEAVVEAAPVVEAPASATPSEERSCEEAPSAEAPSVEEAPAEPISIDPSGFGVVEVSTTGDLVEFTSAEQDHEIKARRQDERDEEHDRLREETRARATPEEDHEDDHDHDDEADQVEHIGGDAMEEVPFRASRPRRQYKIQEVIKRRQVLLVQVVKEERGNKGAALTTYLSLAGRFSVLMPNTARGGGISRKITDSADRKRLKEIVHDLEVPEGMGVILRTAGATRTKPEVKRDFEYLLRLWESVRELTLRSSAPMLVYEEGSLIKRAIRDLYGRDVDEVVVAGEPAYREAHDFMRMLMPSHARNVKLHRGPTPIFADAGVEAQLDAMFSTQVTLRSGGYLVINQTEALVAIDVNSGRSTREHNIEDTALRTNLEAADEVARQLRLRDLAGLIVVDFIDMEESRNNRAVERRIKDALKNDRARIQVGRISHFGLLEMSRQRIRAGVIEGSTTPCPHCAGAGTVRSTASIALHVLRVLEEALVRSAAHDITLRTRAVVALYILNQKRNHLQDQEQRFGVHITVAADDTLTGANYHALERGEPAAGPRIAPPQHLRVDSLSADLLEEESVEEAVEGQLETVEEPVFEAGRRGGRGERAGFARGAQPRLREAGPEEAEEGQESRAEGEEEGEAISRSRRRRRRRGRGGGAGQVGELAHPEMEQPSDEGLAFMAHIEGGPAPVQGGRRPERGGRGRGRGPGRWLRSTPLPPEFREAGAPSHDESVSLDAEFPASLEAEQPPFEAPPLSLAEEAPDTGERLAATPDGGEAPEISTEITGKGEAAPAPVESLESPATEHASETPPVAEAAASAQPSSVELPSPEAEAPGSPAEQAQAEEPLAEAGPLAEPETAPTEVVITQADPRQPKKAGWWQRAKTSLGAGN